ncbi:MAG: alanine--glyoxylate aminotransferase family protein [bacterium]|nr:alanine--glyoxylate aminotransferase family protein [bacterium]
MQIHSFEPPRRILMGPGPSNVYPEVLEALARPTIGHLDPEFIRMMDETKTLLKSAFQTHNDVTMVVSGPGSAGMESCFVNLVEPGDRVVVCSNGVFGGRMKENVERCGGKAIVVEDEWGRAVDANKLDDALKAHPDAGVVAFVHAETSTGALSDVQTLVDIAHSHNCLTIVDTVTSLGGSPLSVDDWQIDAAYSGSQKCLSCTPGLSPVTFNDRAMEAIKNRRTPVQSWFLDMTLVTAYWGGGTRAYHHTAPINALYGLHEALRLLVNEGLENAWVRHRANHEMLRKALQEIGIDYYVPEGERIPQLNAVTLPKGADDASVRSSLLGDYNLEIGAGLGPLAGKIWRIGLMGYSCTEDNVAYCVDSLRTVLAESRGAR